MRLAGTVIFLARFEDEAMDQGRGECMAGAAILWRRATRCGRLATRRGARAQWGVNFKYSTWLALLRLCSCSPACSVFSFVTLCVSG